MSDGMTDFNRNKKQGVLILVLVAGVACAMWVGWSTHQDEKQERRQEAHRVKYGKVDELIKAMDAAQEARKANEALALASSGTMTIMSSPAYATVKLNGELQYVQHESGVWREALYGHTRFEGCAIKDTHTVEIITPTHRSERIEVTQTQWKGEFPSFLYDATLTPKSEWDKMEFDARMASDTENEFFGAITLNSSPAGATVMFNNKPLLDKDGNVLKTPATFSSLWVKDEKSGKLEEVPVKVDTVLDEGHKVEVFIEGNADMPRYGMQLQRQMWECAKMDEGAIKKLPKDHVIQHECVYSFNKTVDLKAIQATKVRRDNKERRQKEYYEKVSETRKRIHAHEPVSDAEIAELETM